MKRKRVHKPLIEVTGHETVFEAIQVVVAALTLCESDNSSPDAAPALEAVLRLEPTTAVHALWLVVTCVLQGFDDQADKMRAIQLIATVIAKAEPLVNSAYGLGK